jgi:hypothetical protein
MIFTLKENPEIRFVFWVTMMRREKKVASDFSPLVSLRGFARRLKSRKMESLIEFVPLPEQKMCVLLLANILYEFNYAYNL